MTYLRSIQHWFQTLETKSKISFLFAISIIIVLTLLFSWWSLSPSYATLFNQLDEHDAHKVIEQLEQNNITYQLHHDGSEILIDKNLITKTRLKLMSSNMQLTGTVGFELFDKNDFGMTDFSQKINYQRALQGELERTISSLDEVIRARVHLVIPENRLFDTESNKPKAAVTLHLRRNLTTKQVQSIQQLIAASIAHLSIKNVVIVDQDGNTLSQANADRATSHFVAKRSLEQYLNHKVTQILYKIFTKEQVAVKINAEINYDELQRELFNPQAKQITHEKEIKHINIDKKGKSKGQQDLTLEKTYELGHKKELFKQASGTIERLTVSVALPKNTDAQTLQQVQKLIKSSIGFNEKRGDTISVEAIITSLPIVSSINSPKKDFPPLATQSKYHEKSEQLVFLLCFLSLGGTAIVLYRRIQHKKRQQLLVELTHWLNHHE